jgi:hypothetical protein
VLLPEFIEKQKIRHVGVGLKAHGMRYETDAFFRPIDFSVQLRKSYLN